MEFGSLFQEFYQEDGIINDVWSINESRYEGKEFNVQPTFCQLFL